MAEMFYRAVTQAVLLFVSGNWVLSTSTDRTVEGNPTEFMRKITGNRLRRKADGTWSYPAAEEVREVVGTQ